MLSFCVVCFLYGDGQLKCVTWKHGWEMFSRNKCENKRVLARSGDLPAFWHSFTTHILSKFFTSRWWFDSSQNSESFCGMQSVIWYFLNDWQVDNENDAIAIKAICIQSFPRLQFLPPEMKFSEWIICIISKPENNLLQAAMFFTGFKTIELKKNVNRIDKLFHFIICKLIYWINGIIECRTWVSPSTCTSTSTSTREIFMMSHVLMDF